MSLLEIAKQALVALESGEHAWAVMNVDGVKDKLRQAIEQAEKQTHTDHPARHWDRTCPACLSEEQEPNVYGDGTVYRGVRSKDSQTKTVYYTAEKQEPVGWITEDYETDKSATTYDKQTARRWENKGWPVTAIYTAPPRDSWFKLTDAEVWDEWTRAVDESNSSNRVLAFRFARALEDKLKEKNT